MKKLIELDAAIEAMAELQGRAASKGELTGISKAWKRIKALPSVDAVPVVHGHWKEDTGGYGFWICSHCGFVSEASGADILYRYCPHCGARMDGKDGEGRE